MKSFSVGMAMVTVLILMATISVIGVLGQTICNATVEGLKECLPSMTPPYPRPPTATCCKALQSADFPCLCTYKDNPIIKTLGIDIDLAMKIPAQCGIPGAPDHC